MGMDGYLWVGGIEHLLERFCQKGERGDGETEREKFEASIYLHPPKLNQNSIFVVPKLEAFLTLSDLKYRAGQIMFPMPKVCLQCVSFCSAESVQQMFSNGFRYSNKRPDGRTIFGTDPIYLTLSIHRPYTNRAMERL